MLDVRKSIGFLLACGVVLCQSVPYSAVATAGDDPPGGGLALKVVRMLQQGDFEGVAKLHHYPPSYSSERRKEDTSAVARNLRSLFARVGAMSQVKRLTEPAEFYFISVGGGDLPYWESISPYRRGEFPYRTEFSKMGPAMVKPVVLLEGPRARQELVGIEVGLPAESPRAKGTMLEILLELLRERNVPAPANIEQLIEQGMRRSKVGPASVTGDVVEN